MIYLKELTFIEENPDLLPSGLVNFEKMNLLGKVLVPIAHWQTSSYKFNEVKIIMDYIRNPPVVLSEKELMQRSRQCEPCQDYSGGTIREKLNFTLRWKKKSKGLTFRFKGGQIREDEGSPRDAQRRQFP